MAREPDRESNPHLPNLFREIRVAVDSYLGSILGATEGLDVPIAANRKASLLSQALVLMLGVALRGTRFMESRRATDILSHIYSSQCPSGLFKDSERLEHEHRYHEVHRKYLEWQDTYYALVTLGLGKILPRYRLNFLEPVLKTGSVENWLASLDWAKPWRVSNDVLFLALFLRHIEDTDSTAESKIARSTLTLVVNWLESRQDSHTGFWLSGRTPRELWQGMGATFHLLAVIEQSGKAFSFADRILTSVENLQQPDGLFHIDGGGGACSDMDAVDILTRVTQVAPSSQQRVKRVFLSMVNPLVRCQRPDGGFAEKMSPAPHDYPAEIQLSRCDLLSYDSTRSDLWSTWCRLRSLSQILVFCHPDQALGVRTMNPGDGRMVQFNSVR